MLIAYEYFDIAIIVWYKDKWQNYYSIGISDRCCPFSRQQELSSSIMCYDISSQLHIRCTLDYPICSFNIRPHFQK